MRRPLVASIVGLLWSTVAAILIAGTTVIAVARLSLPELGGQQDRLEAWLSETLNRPVAIGTIEAGWRGWAPRITATDVTVLDPEGRAELIHFDRAVIDIAPLGSLASGALRPRSLVLSGVALSLVRHADGRFSVAGMPPPKSPIIKWLIEQDKFAVTEADLEIFDERAQARFRLTDLTVTVRNEAGIKHLAGVVALPANFGERLSFRVTARGSPLDAGWSGGIDFALGGLRSEFLAERVDWRGEHPPPARIDVDAWTRWQAGRLAEASFRLGAQADSKVPGAARLLSARGELRRRDDNWFLQVGDLRLPTRDLGAAPGALSAAWRVHDGAVDTAAVRLAGLSLAPLSATAGGLLPLDERLRGALADAAPDGRVAHLEAAWRRGDGAAAGHYIDARIKGLRTLAGALVPELDALDVAARFNQAGGHVTLDTDALTVRHERLVVPLAVEALTGVIDWQRDAGGRIDLNTRRLAARINEVALAASLALDDLGGATTIGLRVDVPAAAGPRLHELLPTAVLPARGERWLRAVIAQGDISNGHALLRGPLAAFPFDDGEGVLALDFDVSNAELAYSSRWPAARAVDGHVRLRGREVRMRIAAAQVLGAHVDEATITMPELFTRERRVHISGTASGPGQSATDIVMASPLRNGKAARLGDITIGGDIAVTLDMNIALWPGGPREVLGTARFAGNRISAPRQNIVLDEVDGAVSFTRGDWYGEGLTAEFDGNRVGLVVAGGLDDPNYDSEFRMTGTSPARQLVKYLERYAPPVYRWLEHNDGLDALAGELPWKAVLTIPVVRTDGTQLPRRLRLESNLRGLDVGLPWPFGKRSGERKPLSIEVELDAGVASRTRVDFGDTLDAEIAAVRDAEGRARIERAEVLFGTLEPEFERRPGFSLRGYIAHLPLGEWTAFLNRSDRAANAVAAELPLGFDVQIGRLDLLGNRFADLRLRGTRDEQAWHLTLSSLDSSGTARIPRDFASAPLVVELDQLALSPPATSDSADDAPPPDPRRLPALDLHVDAFSYHGIPLGATSIRTRRHADGVALEALRFRAPGFTLDASGEWLDTGAAQHSRFDIAVSSDTLAALLDRFGYNVANIKGGETRIDIAASWPGTPADFSLARLSGDFELDVADGRILDIDPGGGRVFGLLSLQSLPRRLSLDFDDLFRKGFAFDSIEGSFLLANGNAYTNSLMMEGPAARIDVSGRTGLEAKDYDQRVVVTPALSNSIPIAGALFGPIGVGAGAVYYLGQKMFKSIPEQIDRFLSREYSITGSWENPSIDRI